MRRAAGHAGPAPSGGPIRLAALVLALLLLVPAAASAQDAPTVTRLAERGFGDEENSYAWSMAWFRGKLYVGTARSQMCVEGATLDFYNPGKGHYRSQPDSDVACPADKYDLDLRAEIWQFTPRTGTWKRVYQAPNDVPNPRAPGKLVARDIGYRGMVVHDGALYVGGVTADEYIPELAETHPPRILRSTDGETFTPIAGAPSFIDTAFGRQRPIGYRAMAVFRDRLFVTASGGLTGDGVILEVDDPDGEPAFTQISPPSMQVFELEPFAERLYVGAGSAQTGYSVWRTDASGPSPAFTPVVEGGAGRGSTITSVVAMHVFKNRLYVGASGWFNSPFPASELIRVNADDTWDLVVGNTRLFTHGALFRIPISGLGDGFNNMFNAHFWRAQEHDGALYVGTNDWSWSLRTNPLLDPLFRGEYGFDMFGTCDGQYWWPVTRTGFGDPFDYGARTLASTFAGMYAGSANHARGASVWRRAAPSPCAARPGLLRAAAARRGPPARPGRLVAAVRRCGTALSWDRARGARRYRIQRARYESAPVPNVRKPPALPNGYLPDLPPAIASGPGTSVSVPGRFRRIGTTRRRAFLDRRTRPGERYQYQVVAVGRRGRASGPSNPAIVPSLQPARASRAGADRRRVRFPRGTC